MRTLTGVEGFSSHSCKKTAQPFPPPPPCVPFQQRDTMLFVEQETDVRLEGSEAVFIIIDCSRQLLKATRRTVEEVCVRLDRGVVLFQFGIVGIVIILTSESSTFSASAMLALIVS